jgi:hypothetical protein
MTGGERSISDSDESPTCIETGEIRSSKSVTDDRLEKARITMLLLVLDG